MTAGGGKKQKVGPVADTLKCSEAWLPRSDANVEAGL